MTTDPAPAPETTTGTDTAQPLPPPPKWPTPAFFAMIGRTKSKAKTKAARRNSYAPPREGSRPRGRPKRPAPVAA